MGEKLLSIDDMKIKKKKVSALKELKEKRGK